MSQGKRVLVTGSAGRIGQAAVQALLDAGHTVTGFDQRPTPHLPESAQVLASLTDGSAITTAARGQDVIIHLAATPDDAHFPRPEPPHDQDNFLDALLPNNIVGTYQVLEAARVGRVPRLVLASTGQVIWDALQHGPWPIPTTVAVSPRYWYACTKVFLEAAGQAYAAAHGLSVLVVRLGWCPRTKQDVDAISKGELWQDTYLSPGDAGRFFQAAVAASTLPPSALASPPSRPPHLTRPAREPARRLLGSAPADTWPAGSLPIDG
ncbi:MAG TPA: NAD(P)-dependent oxidoreductase [Gemmatales bacterium]|nr:NAD(P)-dependent oxidoreductase [Gemmatales bacterium]